MKFPHFKYAMAIELLFVTLVYSVFAWLVLPQADDLKLAGGYRALGTDGSMSLSGLWEYAEMLRRVENGRLAQVLVAPAVLWLPRWLFALLTGITVAAMFRLMTALSNIKKELRAGVLDLVWAASLVLMPWRDNIMLTSFLLNYLYPGTLLLLSLYLITKQQGKLAVVVAVLSGFAAAWGHEACGLSMCAGLVVYIGTNKGRVKKKWWALLIASIAGTALVASAPAMWERVERTVNDKDAIQVIIQIITRLPAVCLMIAMALFSRLKHQTMAEAVRRNPAGVVCFVGAMAGAVIVLCVDAAPRAAWFAEMMALTTLVVMIAPLLKNSKLAQIVNFAGNIAAICILLLMIRVLGQQYTLYKQHIRIEQEMQQSPTGTAYVDLVDISPMRAPSLFLPMKSTWIEPMTYMALNMDYRPGDKVYTCVPASLRGFSPDKAQKVGTNIYRFENQYVTTDTTANEFYRVADRVTVDFPYNHATHALKILFRTPDGTLYGYLLPQ